MYNNTENLEKLFEQLLEGKSVSLDLVISAKTEFDKLKSADFWTNWVYPYGANPFQVQDELFDYHMILQNVSQVYCHVTNNQISKPNTLAREVIMESDYVISKIVEEELEEYIRKMLNSNHTAMVVAIFKVINGLRTRNTKISKSTKFPYFIISRPLRTKEEITKKTNKFEHGVIQIVNFYNKIVNFFRNNKLVLWIKEAFYSLYGTPYPEFLYNGERNDYVSSLQYGKTEDGKPFTEFGVTSSVEYAIDFSKYWFWKKKKFLKDMNSAMEQYNIQCENDGKYEEKIVGKYHFRKILTYEKIS